MTITAKRLALRLREVALSMHQASRATSAADRCRRAHEIVLLTAEEKESS
jgi:hypothetical protein